jgi:hypothetical protein
VSKVDTEIHHSSHSSKNTKGKEKQRKANWRGQKRAQIYIISRDYQVSVKKKVI